MNKIFAFTEERCIMCGAVIPESRQVCPLCEPDVKTVPNQLIDWQLGIPAPSLMCRIWYWLRSAFCR